MNPLLRILIGLVIMGVGSYGVIRMRTVMEFLGPIQWAEMHMGGGGSYFLYKIIGIFVAFIGIFVATNLWDWFLAVTLGSLFPTFG